MNKIWTIRELHSLNNLIARYFDFSSRAKEIDAVTCSNICIIGYLSDNTDKNVYQRNLEDRFTITRSTASKELKLMEQKGLIQRQSVSCDARLKKIVLTEKAWELRNLMKEDVEKMEQVITKGFKDEELKILYSYIQRMKENISNTKSTLQP